MKKLFGHLFGAFAGFALLFGVAQAQVQNPGVQQTGSVTPNNCAAWNGTRVIKDAGAPCATTASPVSCAQLPAFTGDVTKPLGGCTLTLQNAAVTYAKIQNVAAFRLLGNPTGSPAAPSEIDLGATLAFNGTQLQTGAITGDVTTSANSFATTLATVNANVGTFGSASKSVVFTVNAKGLVTAASDTNIAIPFSQVTGQAALTQLPTIANNTALGNVSGASATPTAIAIRPVLTGARTYFVSTTGNDSNDCLSVGAPCLTIQHAYDLAAKIDFNGFAVTIQLADGTYTAGLSAQVPVFGGVLTINGNSGTPTNVVVSTTSADAFAAINGSRFTIQNLRATTTTSGNCVSADGGGTKVTTAAGFSTGACASTGLLAQSSGEVRISAGMTIAGNASSWLLSQNSGIISSSGTITLSGTPVWGVSGITFDTTGVVTFFGSTVFSGSATGKRYQGTGNAVLNSFGAGTSSTFFPGSSNGTVATGAQQL